MAIFVNAEMSVGGECVMFLITGMHSQNESE